VTSNGYEAAAAEFIAARSSVGASTVHQWAATLRPGAHVLELGCGTGAPVATTLTDAGCVVWGIDASPTLLAEFRRRCPSAPAACEPVETSPFFGRTFDAVVAIGLLFLLPAEVQSAVIRRVADALEPGGRLLFTAPRQAVIWPDALTGRPSIGLGDAAYRHSLSEAGLSVVAEYVDEGGNHYYDCQR
jgi:SAM-dependent methyltransferase